MIVFALQHLVAVACLVKSVTCQTVNPIANALVEVATSPSAKAIADALAACAPWTNVTVIANALQEVVTFLLANLTVSAMDRNMAVAM